MTIPLVNNYSRTRQATGYCQVTDYCDQTIARIASRIRNAIYAILILCALGVCGCVNSEIGAAREELANGNFVAAHERFVAASHSPNLTARDRRELADGLCLTEAKLGAPPYPLAEQRRTCADAVALPGSSSEATLSSIDTTERLAIGTQVDGALKAGDIAGAQAAAVRYQSFPGADQQAIAGWSRQIWSALVQQEGRSKYHDRHLVPAIAAISSRYPKMRATNEIEFKHWVMDTATVSRTPLVDRIDLHDGAINLQVASTSLPDIALNLDRFAQINDAMVARCRCDGRTNIAVEGSGLPAYLLRLDPETRHSEVLIMPQPH